MIMKRKYSFFNKKALACFMCGLVFFSVPQVANATSAQGESGNIQPSLESNVALNIGTEAIMVDITVPGTLTFAFNADGSNEIPDNFNIRNNNKIAYFYLKNVGFDSKESGWKLAAGGESIAMDEQAIKLKMGLKNAEKEIVPANGLKDTKGQANFSKSEFVLEPEVDTKMSFLVERPIYTESIPQNKAFDMTMSFEMR